MARDWRTARVFISSTFRDMHSERDWLIKRVFPALRECLEPHRVHLVDIDLRWGITEEQSDNDEVLDVCLKQIDHCRPFFLGILGERYGWVPESLPDADSRQGWTQQHTGKSVTELEILWGALLTEKMRSHALFFFRNPAFIAQVPEAKRADVTAESAESAAKLARLKQTIRESDLPIPVVENYPCRYAGLKVNWRLAKMDLNADEWSQLEQATVDGIIDNAEYLTLTERQKEIVHTVGIVSVDGLEEFGQLVLDRLWDAIRTEFALDEYAVAKGPPDPLDVERGYHERFMESRLRVYIGRESLQQELTKHADGADGEPALITGASGSGKSAALAKFAKDYAEMHPGVLVIPYFTGASPASTSLRQTLFRLCSELKAVFLFSEDVPPDINGLITTFRQFVSQVPADRRVLLVLDALNQLDESDNAQHLYWLPWQFPPHVRVVVSCIDDPDRDEPVLRAFEHRPHVRIDVPPLANAERFEIVREVPSLSAKSLDPRQVQLLLQNPVTANPLFLLVALEELRGFGSYEQLGRRIEHFPTGDDAVTELFIQVLQRLQDEFDATTVYDILTLLACARRGLSDRELLDLIETPAVAIIDSQSDLFPILRQLRPYLQHRGGLRDFFHRNLYKAVNQHFLPDESARSSTHARLAKYFQSQDYFTESLDEQRARAKRLPPTPRPANIRKVDEFPWQLLQVAKLSGKDDPTSPHWDAVADLFTDLHFLEAAAEGQA